MPRGLPVVFVLLAILAIRPAPPTPLYAQSDELPDDGCEEQVIARLETTTNLINYRTACDVFKQCVASDQASLTCQVRAFKGMLDQCPADDGHCHDGAILFAAALVAYDHLFSGERPPETVIESIPLALEAYWQGDDAGALAAYQLTPHSEYWDNVALPLSRAVLYQRLKQTEMALAEYDTAFEVVFDDPLIYYARSQLYAELERLDEAAVDIIALAAHPFDDPAVLDWVAALQTQFPLSEPGMSEWLYYPVNGYGYGPGGSAADLSIQPPHPVQVGVLEESGIIVAIGLKYWTVEAFEVPDTIAQILRLSEDGSGYSLNYPEVGENYGTLTLTPIDGGYAGKEALSLFEGGVTWEFMLVPADAPDPRLALDASTRFCEGGVRSRLGIGAVVTSISFSGFRPLLFTDTPAGAVVAQIETYNSAYATIVDGPECVGSVVWWEGIHSDGTRGWFAENEETLYVAAPVTMEPDTPFCAGQPPVLSPRLTVGTSAIVLPDLGANNLRREPSIEAESVGTIPPDTTFEIIGGPVCVDDTVWWYADYEGVQGWTAEGQAPDYWVAPVE
ncbi:MAG: hypothetical protein K8L91_21045 [Anaerolineae bacterium]|nr:hypothetical protein [Anaerolineae bacterium]